MIYLVYLFDKQDKLRLSQFRVEETNEKFDEKQFEEPDSDEEPVFDPSKENYTMMENPMLRRRIAAEEGDGAPSVEDVD